MKNLTLLSVIVLLFSCGKEYIPGDENSTDELQYATTTITTKPGKQYNNFFTRYGNGWTGGDATYSIKLPDGRNLWTFGDSFLDTVYADRSRPATATLIRNSFIIQDGPTYNDFHTLVGGTIDAPQAMVNTPDQANAWYWPGDATVVGDVLYMYMTYFISTGGGGGFGFQYVRTDLVKFSLPDITEISRSTVWNTDNDVIFGAAVMEDGSYLYIYGPESTAFLKYVQVARVPLANIESPWEYYNAVSGLWQSTYPGVNGRLPKNPSGNVDVSSQFSVFYEAGKYRLLTQEGLLGHHIYSYESDSPVGPWASRKLIYTTDEGTDVWTYNAYMHNDIKNAAGYMLMSYNLNAINFLDLYSNADTYRPKFVWVKYN